MSLPNGYKRLEYIQSSGTQYVDSGFKPNSNTKVVADYYTTSTQGAVIGSDNSWMNSDFVIEVHFAAFCSTMYGHSSVPSGRHVATLDKGVFSLDGETLATMAGTFTGNYNLTLFALNRSNSIQEYGTLRLYSCQIYDNGTLIRDYIPCQTTSGEIGLWDDVNSVFYGNAGTGAFTAGPVVGVATPANFRLSSSSEATATLAWDAVDGATGYKLYRDGVLIATLTDTSYTDAIQPFAFYVYTLTAYNDDGESEAAALTYYAAPDNPILYLVTDRTAADVAAQNAKGTYNASDLNRVGAAMNYVADRLRAAGYDPHISPKTDWKDGDWIDPAAQAVYLGDLAELRKQFAMMKSTPEVPQRILATGINTNDGLTHTWANDIEQILMDIDALLTNIAAGWFYSGELYAGEV